MRQDYSDDEQKKNNHNNTLILKESTKLCVGNLQQVYSDLGHNFPICNININSRMSYHFHITFKLKYMSTFVLNKYPNCED